MSLFYAKLSKPTLVMELAYSTIWEKFMSVDKKIEKLKTLKTTRNEFDSYLFNFF